MTDARDWDTYWLDRALLNASMSTCLTRHVGAVAVRDRRSFADGFNGNLPGAVHCVDGGCDRCARRGTSELEQPTWQPDRDQARIIAIGDALGVCVCVHAEVNVVAFCARQGIRMDGATIYTTHRPCMDCVKLVASAGVLEVVYAEPYPGAYEDGEFLRMRRFHQ